MWQSTQICKTKWHWTPFCSFLVSTLGPSKRSRFIAILIRFARQQRLYASNHMDPVSLKFPATDILNFLLTGILLSGPQLFKWDISKLHKVSPQRPWKTYLFPLLLSLLLIWFPWKRIFRRRYSRCQYICQHQLSQPSFNHTLLSQMIKNPSKISWEKLLDIYVEAVQENPYNAGCIADSCA